MKLLGGVLLVCCGGCIGVCISAAFRRNTAMLENISDMLLSFSIMIEYGTPTVDEMINNAKNEMIELPHFISNSGGRASVIEALKKDPDGLCKADASKLTELFTQLGSADKDSELQRLAAARAYFLQRTETERPKNEKRAELSRKLGILCGIFAAVMLI